ncbi:hypothetical protein [Alicyclobacillus dauci]|uniref:Glycosyl transferase family 2 n=1 Tax=Alicyclobacillus dauci TaxID=1475485 RepID=A0ABY6Z4T6_9BACL|nr:hypothetical protein [Alicyclobacillus dauci]WAH37678.1 hypothetical protein NZD86_03965 [Alicyclobacillus dauci]
MWAQLIVWTLAIYGTLMIVRHLFSWLGQRHEQKRSVYFVLVTENAEWDVEGVLRRLIHKCRNMEFPTRLYVIDVNSTDLTIPIVERLSERYMHIELVPAATYDEALQLAEQVGEKTNTIRCILQLRSRGQLTTIVK